MAGRSGGGRPAKGPRRGEPPRGGAAGGASSRRSTAAPGPKSRGGSQTRGGTGVGRATRSSQGNGLGGQQVEGRQAVRELLLAGRRKVRDVWVAAELDRSDVVTDILDLARELRVPVEEVARRRLDAESRTEAAQGVLAHAAELPDVDLDALTAGRRGIAPFLLAIDGVTDPGNLGALIRTAECAAVTGVVLPRHRAVHITPTVTKAAAGAVEYVPMSLVGGLPTAIERMKQAGVWVVGLDSGGTTSIHELDMAAGPVCLVLGAEGRGLSRLVRQRCDVVASIPLLGQVASLNVSTAGALGMYEVVRRRAR